MTNPSTLGELIRERRLARGLSLGQLATAVGRTAATVRSWEREQHAPAPDVVDRLAEALRIDVSELEAFLYQDPPSLTVVADDDDTDVSESTSVSGEASIETADGEGDDDTVEAGEMESAPAAAASDGKASIVAASADELGVMPRISVPPEPDATAAEAEDHPTAEAPPEPAESEADGAIDESADEEGAGEEDAGEEDAGEDGPVADLDDADHEELVTVSMSPADAAPVDEAPQVEFDADDEPTEAIGPPVVPGPAQEGGHVGVAVRAEMLAEPALPPFLAPLRSVFDPNKKWLYWIRGSLTVVTMLVLLFVLAWAAGELFDGLGAVLDTIESTDSLASDLAPNG